MTEHAVRVGEVEVEIPRPRDTPFMEQLVTLVNAHEEAMARRQPRYQPQASQERAQLRAHIATASPEDQLDMARARFYHFEGKRSISVVLREICSSVDACREELGKSKSA